MAMTGLEPLALHLPRVTALIGGGGKTTLLYLLGQTLAEQGKSVLLTTTTHLAQDDCAVAPESADALNALLAPGKVILAAYPAEDGRMTGIPPQWYPRLKADYILVEADGSRRRPLKVHRENEPVIPEGTELVFQVAGLSALGRCSDEVIHHPEEMGLREPEAVRPELIAFVLLRGAERCPCECVAVLNQADDAILRQQAFEIKRMLEKKQLSAVVTRLKGEIACWY